MNIAIIKYNAGNIQSVLFAMDRLGIHPKLTSDPEEIKAADKVIFPGVGEASSTMADLHNLGLDKVIPALKQPVLGICIGMQLMCRHSEENNTDCLGIFDVDVKRFRPNEEQKMLKVPHMGWNTITDLKTNLFSDSLDNEYAYFVHSYYIPLNEYSIATTDYVHPFSAGMHRDNFYAVQFHPEKSAKAGEQLLKNFLEI
ncbi:MAG: imidazole glycerol phosphate synthase subunit HisH [Bacteroidota bacterium]